jgi:hypothetical protein
MKKKAKYVRNHVSSGISHKFFVLSQGLIQNIILDMNMTEVCDQTLDSFVSLNDFF